jgi:hypothetical protein
MKALVITFTEKEYKDLNIPKDVYAQDFLKNKIIELCKNGQPLNNSTNQ